MHSSIREHQVAEEAPSKLHYSKKEQMIKRWNSFLNEGCEGLNIPVSGNKEWICSACLKDTAGNTCEPTPKDKNKELIY